MHKRHIGVLATVAAIAAACTLTVIAAPEPD
jgi:hypothetical protein